jgi:hypothetical protein
MSFAGKPKHPTNNVHRQPRGERRHEINNAFVTKIIDEQRRCILDHRAVTLQTFPIICAAIIVLHRVYPMPDPTFLASSWRPKSRPATYLSQDITMWAKRPRHTERPEQLVAVLGAIQRGFYP